MNNLGKLLTLFSDRDSVIDLDLDTTEFVPSDDMDWKRTYKRSEDSLRLLEGTQMLVNLRRCGKKMAEASALLCYMTQHPLEQVSTSDEYQAKIQRLIGLLCDASLLQSPEIDFFDRTIYSHSLVRQSVRIVLEELLKDNSSWLVGETRLEMEFGCCAIMARDSTELAALVRASDRQLRAAEEQTIIYSALKFLDACIRTGESGARCGRALLAKANLMGSFIDLLGFDYEDSFSILKRVIALDERAHYMAHYHLGRLYQDEAGRTEGQQRRDNHTLTSTHYKQFLELAPDGHPLIHETAIALPYALIMAHVPEGRFLFHPDYLLSIAEQHEDLPKEVYRYFKLGLSSFEVHYSCYGSGKPEGCPENLFKATTMVVSLYLQELLDEYPINPYICANMACFKPYFWKDLFRCGGCCCVRYCSKECQKFDWGMLGNHNKAECKKLKARLDAQANEDA